MGNLLCQQNRTTRTRCWQPNRRHQHHKFQTRICSTKKQKVTYGRIVCDIKENNTETHRTRLTVGRNLLDFAGLLSTPTATVTTTKCLFKSVIFTPGEKCLIADVKNFYLNNDPRNLNTQNSPSKSSLKKSLTNTTFTK